MILLIKSIELRNWKTHRETRLDFSKGTNILIGQMGAGKSSLMDAISFALFGTFPAIQHKRVNMGRLIRNKPEQAQDGSVKLAIEINGDEYTIIRELSLKGKPTATIEKNGAYLQSQPERVTEEVERILKVDYDLFSKAIYSEQNQLDYFLDLRAFDRKKQIDGLLGLDKFATAQENATSLINRIRDMISESERLTREFDITKASSELQDLKGALAALEKEKEQAEKGIKAQKEHRSRQESEALRLKEMQGRKISLSREIEGLRGRISLLDSEIRKADQSQLSKKADALAEKSSLQDQLSRRREEEKVAAEKERSLNSQMAKFEADLSTAKKDNAELVRIKNELEKNAKESVHARISECGDSIDKLSIASAHSRSIVSETEQQLRELKSHMSKCPICERELDDQMIARITDGKKVLILEHEAKARDLEAKIARKRSELKELNALLASVTVMEAQMKRHADSGARMAAAESGLLKARAEYEKARAGRDNAAKVMQELADKAQRNASQIEMIERIERHVLDRDRLSAELLVKSKEHDSIMVDEKMIEDLQSQLLRTEAEISRHSANLNSASKGIREKELQVRSKEAEIEKINRIYSDLSKKRSLVDNLSKFKMSLSETQSVLRVQLINSINEIMHEVWKELYPYGDYQSVVLDASDDGYDLKVKTLIDREQVWESVESIASGGERSTACLAMRIAFSLVLVPNLKWLILDEPTHNIDQQGLSRFVKMFSETLPGIVDQVFIITHDDILKQVNNARIYVLNRNKEEHGATIVSEA